MYSVFPAFFLANDEAKRQWTIEASMWRLRLIPIADFFSRRTILGPESYEISFWNIRFKIRNSICLNHQRSCKLFTTYLYKHLDQNFLNFRLPISKITEDGRSMTTFYYCSVNHQSSLKRNTFSKLSYIFFDILKCALNYVI
jgi:hypothetical protein